MELQREAPQVESNQQKLFRHSVVSDLFGSLVFFGLLGGGAFALWKSYENIPILFWLVLGPMALMGGLLFGVIGATFFGAFLSSLKATNWYALVGRKGVHLNLRSYKNGHFGGEHPTVLYLPFSEIESMRIVTERSEDRSRDRRVERITRTLELKLRHGRTSELIQACRLERAQEPPTTKRFGIEFSTKHQDVRIYVPTGNTIRVTWVPGLIEALRDTVREEVTLDLNLDRELETLPLDERVRELTQRGETLAARELLESELGLDKREAKQRLRAFDRKVA